MNKNLLSGIVSIIFLLTMSSVVSAVTIDGVISPGEWDAYYLGTSTTTDSGGMQTKVYGFEDSTYLYTAYQVDIANSPGWATACALSIPPNFYTRPEGMAWTLFEMTYAVGGSTPNPAIEVQQEPYWTGIGTKAANGISEGWKQPVPGASCLAGSAGENVAEFKIPLSLLNYGGTADRIEVSGQYWQYGWDDQSFYVSPPPEPPKPVPSMSPILMISLLASLVVIGAKRIKV